MTSFSVLRLIGVLASLVVGQTLRSQQVENSPSISTGRMQAPPVTYNNNFDPSADSAWRKAGYTGKPRNTDGKPQPRSLPPIRAKESITSRSFQELADMGVPVGSESELREVRTKLANEMFWGAWQAKMGACQRNLRKYTVALGEYKSHMQAAHGERAAMSELSSLEGYLQVKEGLLDNKQDLLLRVNNSWVKQLEADALGTNLKRIDNLAGLLKEVSHSFPIISQRTIRLLMDATRIANKAYNATTNGISGGLIVANVQQVKSIQSLMGDRVQQSLAISDIGAAKAELGRHERELNREYLGLKEDWFRWNANCKDSYVRYNMLRAAAQQRLSTQPRL